MEVARALEFAAVHHRAVLCTYRRDGAAQLSPVACTAAPGGTLVVSSRETAYKVRNLRRDPRASICLMNDAFFGDWVQVDATATIESLPDAMEGLVDYYRRVAGEHPDWDDYREAMRREQRVVIRLRPQRAGPDRAG